MIRFALALAVALLGIQVASADEAKLRPGDLLIIGARGWR